MAYEPITTAKPVPSGYVPITTAKSTQAIPNVYTGSTFHPADGTMTVDGVRAPIANPKAMDFRIIGSDIKEPDLIKNSQTLDTTSAQLKAQRDMLEKAKVNTLDQNSVDTFNQQVKDYNAKATQFKTEASKFNQDIADFNVHQKAIYDITAPDRIFDEIIGNDKTQTGFLSTLKNSFLPTQFINSQDSEMMNAARERERSQYATEHPVMSAVAQGIGMIANVALLRYAGAGFGIASKVNSAGEVAGTDAFFHTASRIAGSAAEGGSVFGIQSFLSEALKQQAQKQFDSGELALKTFEGVGTGMAVGAADVFPSYAGRIAAGGGVMGTLTALETYIQNGKLTIKDLPNILVNVVIGAAFEALGGTEKTRIFKQQEMNSISNELTIGKILDNHPEMTRAEAMKISSLLSDLNFIVKSGYFQQLPPSFAENFKNIPSEIGASSRETKLEYFKNLAEEVTNGKTIPQAIDIVNTQPFFSGVNFDRNVLKGQEENLTIPTNLQPLAEEARKYKSAEEFVNSKPIYYRGTTAPQIGDIKPADTYGLAYGKGIYLASDSRFAKDYGPNVKEYYVDWKNPFVMNKPVPNETIDQIKKDFPNEKIQYGELGEDVYGNLPLNQNEANDYLQKLGFDGLKDASSGFTSQSVLFDSSSLKTKSQLTDFYNQAVGEKKPLAINNNIVNNKTNGKGQTTKGHIRPEIEKPLQSKLSSRKGVQNNRESSLGLVSTDLRTSRRDGGKSAESFRKNDQRGNREISSQDNGSGVDKKTFERESNLGLLTDLTSGKEKFGSGKELFVDQVETLKRHGMPEKASEQFSRQFYHFSEEIQKNFQGFLTINNSFTSAGLKVFFNGEWNVGINPAFFEKPKFQTGSIAIHEVGGHLSYALFSPKERAQITEYSQKLIENEKEFTIVFSTGIKFAPHDFLETVLRYYRDEVDQTRNALINAFTPSMGIPKALDIAQKLLDKQGVLFKGGPKLHINFADIKKILSLKNKLLEDVKKYVTDQERVKIFNDGKNQVANEIFARSAEYAFQQGDITLEMEPIADLIEPIIQAKGVMPSNGEPAQGTFFDKNVQNRKPSPLERKLEELGMELDMHKEALANNPAKELIKYVSSQTGRLPEITGKETMESINEKGKTIKNSEFGQQGDKILQKVFGAGETYGQTPDIETAQLAVDNYKLQQKRIADLEERIKETRKAVIESRSEDKDMKSLQALLERTAKKTDKERTAMEKALQSPETEAELAKRKEVARERMVAILERMYRQTSPMERDTPAWLVQLTEDSYGKMTPDDFEKISEGDPTRLIHIDENTPVKLKVNIVDRFLRTPDRVLQKIGLGNEMANIRHAVEMAEQELPAHIDLIREWKKRGDAISPQTNKQIFKYLDGQKTIQQNYNGRWVPLLPKELELAREIRGYLKEWADRLGLPADNKISHYITHLFGVGEVEKEFDDEIAKIIANKVPGSVYDPFLLKRLGRKGYLEDTWKALEAYAKRAVRKANMDPALEHLKDVASNMEESQQKYIQRYAGALNMRPTEIENETDNFLKSIFGYKFGQRPTATITRFARKATYRAALGLNLRSAIKNLTQGVNTFAKLGTKYTAIGYTRLLSEAGSNELKESGVLKQDFIQDKTLSAVHQGLEKMDKGLFFMFELAEKINRGAAYFGAFQKGIDEGMTEMQAREYAKKLVRDTQFSYGAIDTPVGLNNDIAKMFTQFFTFPIKQGEFLAEMAKNKEYAGLIRYIVAAVLITFTIGKAWGQKGRDFLPISSFIPKQGYGGQTRFGTPASLALPLSIAAAVYGFPGTFSPTKGPKGGKSGLEKTAADIAKNIPFPATVEIQSLINLFGKKSASSKGKKALAF